MRRCISKTIRKVYERGLVYQKGGWKQVVALEERKHTTTHVVTVSQLTTPLLFPFHVTDDAKSNCHRRNHNAVLKKHR